MNRVVLLLGSNLGNKEKNIHDALIAINQSIGEIKKKSEILKTSPEGYISNHSYLNLGIVVETLLSPTALLRSVKKIERDLGRLQDTSQSGNYEDRTMDIDIIHFNNIIFHSKKLSIPHLTHIKEREFSKKILLELI